MPNYLIINDNEVSFRNIQTEELNAFVMKTPNTGLLTAPVGINHTEFANSIKDKEDEIRSIIKDNAPTDLIRIFVNAETDKEELIVYLGALSTEPKIHKLNPISLKGEKPAVEFVKQVGEIIESYCKDYTFVEVYYEGLTVYSNPLKKLLSQTTFSNVVIAFEISPYEKTLPLYLIKSSKESLPKLPYVTTKTFNIQPVEETVKSKYTNRIKEINKQLRNLIFDRYTKTLEVKAIPEVASSDLAEMTELCEVKDRQLTTLQAEVSEYRELLDVLEHEGKILKERNAKLELDILDYDTLKVENIELKSELDTTKAELERTLSEFKETIHNQEGVNKSEIDSLTEELIKLKEMEHRYTILQEQYKSLSYRNDDLETELSVLESNNETLESALIASTNEIETLKSKVVELETHAKLEHTLVAIFKKLSQLCEHKDSYISPKEVELEELSIKTMEELEVECASLEQAIQETETQVAEQLMQKVEVKEEEEEISDDIELPSEIIDSIELDLEIEDLELDIPDLDLELPEEEEDFEIESLDLEEELNSFFDEDTPLSTYLTTQLPK